MVEFYHRVKTMEYEIEMQQDNMGQLQCLIRMCLQQLQLIPEYKQELEDISKGIKRFFQKSTWLHDAMSYSIDEILYELEDADVYSTITLDTPKSSTTNASRVGRENVYHQQTKRRPFIPKEEYIKQQREKREQHGVHKDNQKDCTCVVCECIIRELHK